MDEVEYVLSAMIKAQNRSIRTVLRENARIKHYKRNETIFHNGDMVYEIMFCVKGIFKCVSFNSDGKEELCCINSAPEYCIMLPMNFDLHKSTVFDSPMIAATDCTAVAFPLEVIRELYEKQDEMKMIVNRFYKDMFPYYQTWMRIMVKKGIDRYESIIDAMSERWALLDENDKALCMGLDYSYWMRFKKKYGID